jgi:tripartite motif-containing protein 2/3
MFEDFDIICGQFFAMGSAYIIIIFDVMYLLVTDKWRHCVHVFSRDGRYLRQLGAKGDIEGTFLAPEGVASDSDAGVLYVCDTCNDRIQVIRMEDGAFVRMLGVTTTMSTNSNANQTTSGTPNQNNQVSRISEFNQPTCIALGTDRVVVCDHGNRRIKVQYV